MSDVALSPPPRHSLRIPTRIPASRNSPVLDASSLSSKLPPRDTRSAWHGGIAPSSSSDSTRLHVKPSWKLLRARLEYIRGSRRLRRIRGCDIPGLAAAANNSSEHRHNLLHARFCLFMDSPRKIRKRDLSLPVPTNGRRIESTVSASFHESSHASRPSDASLRYYAINSTILESLLPGLAFENELLD